MPGEAVNRQERRAGLAFARSSRNEWHPFERVDAQPGWWEQHAQRLAHHIETTGDLVECWRNNVYSVQVFQRGRIDKPPAKHLAIRRHDGAEVKGWDDLQRIKNEVVGADFAAIEIYPPVGEVMNQANMRHLFVLPLGEPAPFTIQGRWS